MLNRTLNSFQKSIFNQQSASSQKVPPGARAPLLLSHCRAPKLLGSSLKLVCIMIRI